MNIKETEKKASITKFGVVVKKNGETYFVDLTITVNHKSGEVDEVVDDIVDGHNHHYKEGIFTVDEMLKIMDAAKWTF